MNQYIVIRDLGQGSSAEVRLCRRMRHGGESKTGNNLEGVGAAREGESGQEERATEADMAQSFVEGDDDSGLYVSLTGSCLGRRAVWPSFSYLGGSVHRRGILTAQLSPFENAPPPPSPVCTLYFFAFPVHG